MDLEIGYTELATLTRRDIANRLNVSYSSIQRWEQNKNDPIPHTRRGAVIRFNGRKVDEWWNEQSN